MSRGNRLRIKGLDLQAGGFPASLPEVIGGLLAHPGVGRRFEHHFQPDCKFRGDGSLSLQHLGQPLSIDIEPAGRFTDGKAKGVQDFFLDNDSRMRWIMHSHKMCLSMVIFIVHYLHISFDKSKGHPPVGLHRDRPGVMSTAFQRVQTKTWNIHVIGACRHFKPRQDMGQFFGVSGLYARFAAGTIKSFQAFVKKALNHVFTIILFW